MELDNVYDLIEAKEEIERLNNIVFNQNKRNSHQRIANDNLQNKNKELNNIINELEKMIKNDLEFACSMNENGLFNGAIDMLEVYLNKLQELKGSE